MTQAIIPLGTSAADTGAPGAATGAPSANPVDWSNALAQAGNEAAPTPPHASTAQPAQESKIPKESTAKTSTGKAATVQTDTIPQIKKDTHQAPETGHNARAAASDKPASHKHKNTEQSATASLSPFADMLLGVAATPATVTSKAASQNPEEISGKTTSMPEKQNAQVIPAKGPQAQTTASAAQDTQIAPTETPAPKANDPKSVSAETQAMANTVVAKAESAMAVSTDPKNVPTGVAQTAGSPSMAALPDAALKITAPSTSAHAGATTKAATPAQAGNAAARAATEDLQANASAVESNKSGAASVVSNTTIAQPGGTQAMLAGQPSAAPSTAPGPSAPVTTASVVTQATGSVAATPAALAATITAMHQTGQNSTVLRLDPPGLGSLSVHVALGQSGQVNVLFVPTTAQTAQLLHSGMDGLRQAMTTSGLTLGQAEVSGGGNQNTSQGGQNSPNNPNTAQAPQSAAISANGTMPATSGVRAYA